MARVAEADGFCGTRGLTAPVAERLEGAVEAVPTEASAQAVRAFRGASGTATIRGAPRSLELSSAAAVTFYLDVEVTMRSVGRLAQAVADTGDLQEANRALNKLGVSTELDGEVRRGPPNTEAERAKLWTAMRAIVFEQNGGPEVLESRRFRPRPGEGEVLVEVEAIGVNYRDVYEREGHGYGSEPPASSASRVPDGSPTRGTGRLGRGSGQLRRARGRRRERSCRCPTRSPPSSGRGAAPRYDRALPGFRSYPIEEGDWVLVHAAAGGVG